VLKATIAGLLSHKLRLALTAFSIVLGVAFVGATLTLSNALQTGFDNIIRTSNTSVAAVVRGHVEPGGNNGGFSDAHHPVPQGLVATVESVSGVQAAEGIIFRPGAIPLDKSDKPLRNGNGAPQFLANWISTGAISPFHLRAGSAPTAANDVVIDANTARVFNLKVGEQINYVINGGEKQSFMISGIAGYGTSDTVEGAIISLFRADVAQKLAGIPGQFDRIDVTADSNLSQTEVRDRIAKHLPSYAETATEADTQGQQVQAIDSFFSILRTILLVFALIALFVGSYIIVNTFSILIAQRTRELALLRALGATQRQVFQMVVVEAFITGLIASAVGCLLSVLLASGLYATLSTGVGVPKNNLVLQGSTIVICMVLGVGITLAASVFPARRASRVSPVEAIRDATDLAQPLGRKRITAGVLGTIAGAGLVAVGLFTGSSNAFLFLGVGALILYIAVSSLAPLTVLPVAGTLGILVARFRGTPGKLARTNAVRAPRRVAATAAALMIGTSLVVGIAVLTASVKESTSVALKEAVLADYIVIARSGGGGGGGAESGISPTTASSLAGDSHFSTVSDIKVGTILVNGSSTGVFAVNTNSYSRVLKIDVTSGDSSSLGNPNTIFVDQQTATDNKLSVGDVVNVNFPQKNVTVNERIGCIYNANALLSGYMISLDAYNNYFTEQGAAFVLVKAGGGVSLSAGQTALNTDLRRFPTLQAYDAGAFLALQSTAIDSLTKEIDVFLLMAIIIAALGIVNTLALSILERTRELGLLRAIGLTRRQTRTMVRWESVLIAMLGLVLGTVVGVVLGSAVVKALASTGINRISIPFLSLLGYAVGALVIGLAAGILPARRAARINILEAITTE
jgi:putative ABC transport system permease protein